MKENAAMQPFARLIGNWTTVGSHPMLPGQKLNGKVSFKWIEDGAFLEMRSEMDHPDVPAGVTIWGSDDSAKTFAMLYYDTRGVSRHYNVSIEGNVWKWWRDFPGFSQRFTCTIAEDGNTMTGRGEMCRDGSTWEGDLDLTYKRVV